MFSEQFTFLIFSFILTAAFFFEDISYSSEFSSYCRNVFPDYDTFSISFMIKTLIKSLVISSFVFMFQSESLRILLKILNKLVFCRLHQGWTGWIFFAGKTPISDSLEKNDPYSVLSVEIWEPSRRIMLKVSTFRRYIFT